MSAVRPIEPEWVVAARLAAVEVGHIRQELLVRADEEGLQSTWWDAALWFGEVEGDLATVGGGDVRTRERAHRTADRLWMALGDYERELSGEEQDLIGRVRKARTAVFSVIMRAKDEGEPW